MAKLISFFTALLMFIIPSLNLPEANVDSNKFNTEYTNVFVHGFAGWGEYDATNKALPYWGNTSGDLMKYLNARGFDCHAASVSPTASAWDRACDLYAQLTGTRTDYGEAHSKACGHSRYGKSYTLRPLINEWSAEKKINLFGHSFGGATVRMLAELMANGSEAERSAGGKVSELFTGGKADWIYSIVTLAAPHNGTSSYNIQEDLKNDPNATAAENMIADIFMGIGTAGFRQESDTAIYEMQIDNAMALNEKLPPIKGIYYFSYACDATILADDGTRSLDPELGGGMYKISGARLCTYEGVTPSGYVIDEKWQANDGLVNTYSALVPIGAPSVDYNADSVTTGIWNVMPVMRGNHSTLQGGMTKALNGRIFFVDLLSMINSL